MQQQHVQRGGAGNPAAAEQQRCGQLQLACRLPGDGGQLHCHVRCRCHCIACKRSERFTALSLCGLQATKAVSPWTLFEYRLPDRSDLSSRAPETSRFKDCMAIEKCFLGHDGHEQST
jgi:hypothetical protein